MSELQKFKIGYIYAMAPTDGSHTKSTYYCEVINVDNESVTLNVPNIGTRKIYEDEHWTWNYHMDRMTLTGTKETHGDLLVNQQGLFKQPVYKDGIRQGV